MTQRARFGVRLWCGAVVAAVTSGCVSGPPRFVEPDGDEPHAIVTVRVTHAKRPDVHSADRVVINGREVELQDGNRSASGTVFSLRAPPGGSQWGVGSRFYHYELRSERERVAVTRSTYDSCHSRDYKGYCRGGTRTVTDYEYQNVTRMRPVTRAHCNQVREFQLERGGTYTVSYQFQDAHNCTLSCVEHQVGPTGEPSDVPCKRAPLPTTAADAPSRNAVPQQAPRASKTSSSSTQSLGMASVALGAIGLAGAAAAGGYALLMKEEVGASCDENNVCTRDGAGAAERGRQAVKIGTMSGITGAVLLGTGIVLLNVGSREKGPHASAVVAPVDNGGQISLQGAF